MSHTLSPIEPSSTSFGIYSPIAFFFETPRRSTYHPVSHPSILKLRAFIISFVCFSELWLLVLKCTIADAYKKERETYYILGDIIPTIPEASINHLPIKQPRTLPAYASSDRRSYHY